MTAHRAALAAIVLAAFSAGPAGAGEVALTIYNSDFALVKETRSLSLQAGVNETRFTNVTSLLEPDSVVLRDRKDPEGLRILEQNYEGDPLSEASMLRLSEGKTLQFRNVNPATGAVELVSGRLVRAGYDGGGNAWAMRARGGQPFGVATNPLSPIVELNGKVLFNLPGQPLFDPPGKDAILKPTLLWRLQAAKGGDRDVEVSYMTGGMRWEATYNLVAPETGDAFDLVGWVTLENESGAQFDNARVKLMAGDVNKVQPAMAGMVMAMKSRADEMAPQVTEKAFDEYHLYTLTNPTTLREREVKQVEFCRAAKLPGKRLYVYDGAMVPEYVYQGGMAQQPDLGAQSNPKVATMIEFRNSKEAGLGIPLPKGTMKMYRADSDGSREFIGESSIDHTPADETVRLTVGNAFDLRGERRQTDFKVDSSRQTATEAFEIKVRNHKKEPVEVRVVEHLYRWSGWKIALSSIPFEKIDSRTIQFKVTIPPDGEKVVTYRVNYSW
jgi:hypothetical protein